MKRSFLPYLLCSFVILLFSCSKKTSVPVPKDAAFILHIDGASLQSKLSWEEIKSSKWYTDAIKEVKDSTAEKILNDPSSSGLDMQSDSYIFVVPRGNKLYTGLTVNLKDEKAFTTLVSKVSSEKPIQKKDALSFLAEPNSVLTWNDNRIVVVIGSDLPNPNSMQSYNRGPISQDSLLQFASTIYKLEKSESIGSDDRYVAMEKEKGDLHFWVNPGKLMAGSFNPLLALTKANTLFEGNVSAAVINFEDGKITMKAKNHLNKELAALHSKFKMENMDEDMLKKIASQDVAVAFGFNFPPALLKEYAILLGVDGFANMFLSEAGVTIDDITGAFKGDMVLSVTDFDLSKMKMSGEPGNNIGAKILFGMSLKSKAAFDKLITVLAEKSGGDFTLDKFVPNKITDNWFVVGTDSAQINAFESTNINHSFISKISGHPAGGFVDLQKIIRGASSATKDSVGIYVADLSLKYWQDVIFYGGGIKDGTGESYFEVNMVDKNTNSLKQLNTYLGSIAEKVMEEERKRKAQWEDVELDTKIDPAKFVYPSH